MSRTVRFRLDLRQVEADGDRLLAAMRGIKNAGRALQARGREVDRQGERLAALVTKLISRVPRG